MPDQNTPSVQETDPTHKGRDPRLNHATLEGKECMFTPSCKGRVIITPMRETDEYIDYQGSCCLCGGNGGHRQQKPKSQ